MALKARTTVCAVLLTVLTVSPVLSGEAEERAGLFERRREAEKRLADLQQDQDLLLFLNRMYAVDSKYVLLDLAAGKGELRYRNRLIRRFTFSPRRPALQPPARGQAVLTALEEKNDRKLALVFGEDLVLQVRRRGRGEGPAARFIISQKDLASLFYALDVGSLAYIIR